MNNIAFKASVFKVLDTIGKTPETALPLTNDASTQHALEWLRLKTIAAYADDDKAIKPVRAKLMSSLPEGTFAGFGPRVVLDNPHLVAEADMRKKPSRLDATLLANLMVKKFGCSLDDAQALIGEASSGGAGTSAFLSVVLR